MNIKGISVVLAFVSSVTTIGFFNANANETINNTYSHSFYYYVPVIRCVPISGNNECPRGTFAKVVGMERKEVTYCTPIGNGGEDCTT